MSIFIQDYYLIFMVILLSLAILIMLRTITITVFQVIYFGILILVSQLNIAWLLTLLFAIQIAFTLYLIYRLNKAFDYNFDLVLEKTHLIERNYTKTDYSGSKKSFLL